MAFTVARGVFNGTAFSSPTMTDRFDSASVAEGPGRLDAELESLADLRRLLRGRDVREAAVALVLHDPVGLVRRAREWMSENGYLFDLQELVQGAALSIQLRARTVRDSASLDMWIHRILDAQRSCLLRADEARLEEGPREPLQPRFRILARALGLEHADLMPAMVALNGLPDVPRRALHALLIEREGFTSFANRVGVPARQARAILADALVRLEEAAFPGGSDD